MADAPPVAMVNEKFVRQFFPNENPIGQHLRFPGRFQSERPTTIVGVVRAIHHAGLDQAPVAEMYFPYRQNPWPSQAVVVRTAIAPEEMIATLRRALFEIDPTQAAFDIKTMEQRLDRSVAERRFNMRILTLLPSSRSPSPRSVFTASSVTTSASGPGKLASGWLWVRIAFRSTGWSSDTVFDLRFSAFCSESGRRSRPENSSRACSLESAPAIHLRSLLPVRSFF